MRDDDEAALIALEVVPQPRDGVGVQVVRGLVEKQGLGTREEDPGQLDPAPLTAGERAQGLLEDALLQTQGCGNSGRFGLGGIPAGSGELRGKPVVAPHGTLLLLPRLAGHAEFGSPKVAHNPVQAARREHPVPGRDMQVARARILGQVADLAAAGHRSGGREADTCEHLGQGGFACAIATDQTDPVTRCYPKGRVLQEQARARAQLHTSGGDHNGPSDDGWHATRRSLWRIWGAGRLVRRLV